MRDRLVLMAAMAVQGALGAFVGMSWERVRHERNAHPAPSGECKHLWTDWSSPAVLDTPFEVYSSGHRVTLSRYQDRLCLHCKLSQRSVC
jgi:hypothetical protein